MKIFIIGTGNLAHSLVPAIMDAGHQIVGAYTRNAGHLSEFAQKFGIKGKSLNASGKTGADITIICTADSGIEPSARLLSPDETVVHTSGCTGISALSGKFLNCGVMYPAQTFSKGTRASLAQVPLVTEGSNEATLQKINELAGSISGSVTPMASRQRKMLHLSAVFACNFSNHMIAVAKSLMKECGADFSFLTPLISETMRKAIQQDPVLSQSGPAARNDAATMQAHLQMLEKSPTLGQIYKLASQSIREFSEKYKNGI